MATLCSTLGEDAHGMQHKLVALGCGVSRHREPHVTLCGLGDGEAAERVPGRLDRRRVGVESDVGWAGAAMGTGDMEYAHAPGVACQVLPTATGSENGTNEIWWKREQCFAARESGARGQRRGGGAACH